MPPQKAAPKDPSSSSQITQAHVAQQIQIMLGTDTQLHLIIPRLYISSIGPTTNWPLLQQKNITHILCVASEIKPPKDLPKHIQYALVPVDDVPSAAQQLADCWEGCFNFIDEGRQRNEASGGSASASASASGGGGKRNVLVHCFAGRSRSGATCIAYLMERLGMTLQGALQTVKAARPQVAPNSGFMRQLEIMDEKQKLRIQKLRIEPN